MKYIRLLFFLPMLVSAIIMSSIVECFIWFIGFMFVGAKEPNPFKEDDNQTKFFIKMIQNILNNKPLA